MSLSDTISLGTLGFGADTGPLLAVDAALERLERRAATAEAALNRLGATSSSAFAKINPAMMGMAGPSAAGGSMATPGSIAAAATAQSGLANATATATGAMHAQASALGATTHAHAASSAATYQNRLQMMELAHVARAMFDELAAGGNVFRALAMEGGRLQVALSTGEGGLTGLLGRAGAGLTAMLNPLALVTAGIVAVGAASAYAFGNYEAGQDRLTNSLNGIGRRSGSTLAQLNAIASSGAASGGLSNSQGIGLAAQFAHAGLGADVSQGLIGITKDYGRLTGQDSDKAGGALAGAFADPIKGLGELDKQLGFVDDRLQRQVEDLERSGHLHDAQALAMEALRKAVEGTTDTTWGWKKALEGAENWISNKLGGLGGAIAGAVGADSPQTQLDRYKALLPGTSNAWYAVGDNRTDTVQSKIDALQRTVIEQQAKAASDKRDADATALSRQAGDAVRSILPDIMRANGARDTIEVLRQALADPEIRRHMAPDEARLAGRAYGNAMVLADNADPARRQRQDYDLRMASADAFSVGERAVVEARRAELEVLRQTGDVARAAAAAQMSMNEAIAKGNQDAEDRLQMAKQEAGSIGLSGLAKTIQGIRDQYEGYGGIMSRDAAASGRATDDPTIKADLTHAGGIVTAALSDTGPKVEAAGDKLVKAIEGVATRVGGAAPSPYGTLDHGAFGGGAAATPFFAAGAKAFDAAPANIQAMIQDAANRTGMPAGIIAAIGQKENGYKLTGATGVLGPDGRPATSAYGFGQLTNGAAADVSKVIPGFSKMDPNTAVLGAAEYLKIVLGRHGGDMVGALDAYGTGPGYGADVMRRAGGALAAAPTEAPRTMTIHPAVAPVAPIAPDMLGKDQKAMDQSIANASQTARLGVIQGGAQQVLELTQATKLQADTFGMTADKVAALTFQQKLLAQAQREMITISPSMRDAIKQEADEYGTAAKARADEAARQQSIISTEDSIRGGASGVLSGGLLSAAHGQGFGKGASSALASLGDSLIGKGVDSLIGGFIGGKGQSGGGLFGGMLGNLISGFPHFAGGTSDAPGGATVVGENGPEVVQMPAHASVMSNGALQGLMGASKAPNVSIGGPTINVQGDVGEQNRAEIQRAVAAGQQQTMDHITRNFGQIQRDAGQAG